MSLFDFLRKKNKPNNDGKINDILEPQVCSKLVDDEIINEINKINWSEFYTAYGNTENLVPYYLKNTFCTDESVALEAIYQLWCSISHQGVSMTDTALPAYEILKTGLVKLGNNAKAGILNIFAAFALCTSKEYFTVPNELREWEKEIQKKLLRDRNFFRSFEQVNDDYIVAVAKEICGYLENQKI